MGNSSNPVHPLHFTSLVSTPDQEVRFHKGRRLWAPEGPGLVLHALHIDVLHRQTKLILIHNDHFTLHSQLDSCIHLTSVRRTAPQGHPRHAFDGVCLASAVTRRKISRYHRSTSSWIPPLCVVLFASLRRGVHEDPIRVRCGPIGLRHGCTAPAMPIATFVS